MLLIPQIPSPALNINYWDIKIEYITDLGITPIVKEAKIDYAVCSATGDFEVVSYEDISKRTLFSGVRFEKFDYSSLPDFYPAHLNSLALKFKKEWAEYQGYIMCDLTEAQKVFKRMSSQIAAINYKDIAVELTPDNAIKFTIIVDNNRTIMVTSPLYKIDGLDNDDVIVSVFVNRKLVFSNAIQIHALVQSFD